MGFFNICIVISLQSSDFESYVKNKIHTEVNVYIAEEFDEERDYEEYEQAYPVEHTVRVDGPGGAATSRITYFTRCRFVPQDRDPTPAPIPQPLPRLAVGGTFGPRLIQVPREVVTRITANPRVDPPVTKPDLASEGGSGEVDSDRPLLSGPDVDLVLMSDVSRWDPARWLPESTALHLYARALFGRFEVFEIESNLELYSAGLRMSVPVLEAGPFSIEGAVSAGPGYMRTDIGDAFGLESGAGLQGVLSITRGLSFLASIGANLFLSDDFLSWGPAANAGFNLAW